MEEILMKAKHLSREQLLPAPEIRPSHGNTVKYSEVTGGNGRIVIPQYPGILIGHKIYWSVKGNGTEFSVITVEKLEPSYEAVLRFAIVFDSESVFASYFVMLDDEVLGYSHESPYIVLR
jgi:hypothetical protein